METQGMPGVCSYCGKRRPDLRPCPTCQQLTCGECFWEGGCRRCNKESWKVELRRQRTVKMVAALPPEDKAALLAENPTVAAAAPVVSAIQPLPVMPQIVKQPKEKTLSLETLCNDEKTLAKEINQVEDDIAGKQRYLNLLKAAKGSG